MTESQAVGVPVYQEYMNPLLEALRSQGQALPIEEVDRLVIAAMKLPADIVAIPHDPEKPDRSEVSYRMAWARTYLKKAGLLENHPRGHWAISAEGRDAGTIDAYQLASDVLQALPKSTRSDEPGPPDEVDEELLTARVGAMA
jgi:restriction system protein